MIAGPGGWRFTPEGAAVHAGERTAVVADVHLGYEWSRGSGGDQVPAHSLAETVAKLGALLGRAAIDRLVVAGDLTETAAPCVRTLRDVRRLADWLAGRGVTLVPLMGNHDMPRKPPLPATIEVDGWTIGHGHRAIGGPRIIFGHHHPALKAEGLAAPCFVFGPTAIALPAFSPNAAGLDIRAFDLPDAFAGSSPRCVAGLGGELLDFGPLDALRAQLGGW